MKCAAAIVMVAFFAVLQASPQRQIQEPKKQTGGTTPQPEVNQTVSPAILKALDEVLDNLDEIRIRDRVSPLTQFFQLTDSGGQKLESRPRQRVKDVDGYRVAMYYTPINE